MDRSDGQGDSHAIGQAAAGARRNRGRAIGE
jgi:hypothetical protein